MEIREKLAADNPAVTEFRSRLALSHHDLGLLLTETGKPTEAEAEHRRALEIFGKLAADNPAVTDFRSGLAGGHNNLGDLLPPMNKPGGGGGRVPQGAGDTREAGRPKTPPSPSSAAAWRSATTTSASSYRGRASHRRREAEYRRAMVIQEKLAADNPGIAAYQQGLAQGLSKMGILQRGAGRTTSEAVASFRAAVAVLQRLPTPSPGILYDLACDQALLAGAAAEPNSGISAAEGDAEADRAVATLRRAVAAGYRDVAHMQADTSLDVLRPARTFA